MLPLEYSAILLTCIKRKLVLILELAFFKNRQNKGLNDKWYLNEVRKYCRMLPLEYSAILLTCIKRKLVLILELAFFKNRQNKGLNNKWYFCNYEHFSIKICSF